jgi:hypothetical protein
MHLHDTTWRLTWVQSESLCRARFTRGSSGEALLTRRYAIKASDSEQVIIARAIADVRHYLTQRRNLLAAVVQGGAPEMWNLVRPELEELRAEGLLRSRSEGTDSCHLLERLREALELCGDEAPRAFRAWRAG